MPQRDRFLAGHSLGRASAHMVDECPQCQNPQPSAYYLAKAGHGVCSCGLVSEHLATGMARRQWHSRHKDMVKAEIAAAYLNEGDS